MTNFKAAITAVVMTTAFAGSHAIAEQTAPLAPGKPAGIHNAQGGSPSLLILAAGATVAVIAVVVATQSTSDPVCGSACAATST